MFSFNASRAVATAVAGVGLALAGCGADEDNSANSDTQVGGATATASAPAIPSELRGSYERRVTRDDIERTQKIRDESGHNQQKPIPGPARLVIRASSLKFIDLTVDPPLTIEQSITATADRLSLESYIRPDKGSFCGPEIPQNASYRRARNGAVLHLTALRDPCADRDSSLTGAWNSRP
jgi:hypothetical protein